MSPLAAALHRHANSPSAPHAAFTPSGALTSSAPVVPHASRPYALASRTPPGMRNRSNAQGYVFPPVSPRDGITGPIDLMRPERPVAVLMPTGSMLHRPGPSRINVP